MRRHGLVWVAGGLLAACAGTGDPSAAAPPEPAPPEVSAAPEPGAPGAAEPAAPPLRGVAADDAEFERTLVAAERRVDEFVSLVGDPGASRQRDLVESALRAFASAHLERLLAGGDDGARPARRVACVKVLAFANDRRATAVAVRALGERSDPALQTAAGFALTRLRDRNVPIDALLAAARSPDVDVRVNALVALHVVLDLRGTLGNFLDVGSRDDVLVALDTLLFDPEDPTVRAAAAAAARALGDPRAVPALVHLLQDRDPSVRTHTALALARLGSRTEVAPLLDALGDSPRGTARTAVVAALTRILERERISVPPDLPEDRESWERFTREAFARKDARPVY